MKKFFIHYYNFFNLIKGNNTKSQNEISKLSDLIQMIKDDSHDLTRTFLLSKNSDYNYANIYLKTEQQEMSNLPNRKSTNITINSFNLKSHKKSEDKNVILNNNKNTLDNQMNIQSSNYKDIYINIKDIKNKENDMTIILDRKNQYRINDNSEIFNINLQQNSELNLIGQKSNISLNENCNKYKNNTFPDNKITRFVIGNDVNEISNKKDKDKDNNNSVISFNKKKDNSIINTSFHSTESPEFLSNKKSSIKNIIKIVKSKQDTLLLFFIQIKIKNLF